MKVDVDIRKDTMMEFKDRLAKYSQTARQRDFEHNFLKDVDKYEYWSEIIIGEKKIAQNKFKITAEDIISFNKSCLESDPIYMDPISPVPHPIFYITIAFYSLGLGIGSWIRTPGARNPGQQIEIHDEFKVGETITTSVTHYDKWLKRGKFYMRDYIEMYNEENKLKVSTYINLILPETRSDVLKFAQM